VRRLLRSIPIEYFRAQLDGAAYVPRDGAALIVGNHAMFGIDSLVLSALIHRETGRKLRFLGDREITKLPFLRNMLGVVGVVPGDRENGVRVLRDGHLLGVYPGGVDDSFKMSFERHQLKWGNRSGFAVIAMEAGVPIIPVVGIGIDQMYRVVGHEKFLGRALFHSPRYDLPVALGVMGTPIPRRFPQRFIVQPPIDTSGDPDNPADVERVRLATYTAIESKLREVRKIEGSE
jgi:1-acyl-sn-glycerol-3-phosphate acyltransferase